MVQSLIICVQYKLDPDLIGGMDRYCWAMESQLRSLGIKPLWFFPYSNDIEHYKSKGFEIILISHRDFLQGVFSYLNEKNLHVDIMVTHFTRYFTKEMKWFKKMGVARIISFEHLYRNLKTRTFKSKIKTEVKGLLYYRYCDNVAFVSNYVYKQVFKEYKLISSLIRNKVEVVYNGIDTNVYSKKPERPKSEILKGICACRIVKTKGLHILIDAVEMLEKSEYKDKFKIDVYGEGQDKDEFKNTTAHKQLTGIQFLNNVNNLNELMQEYDIAVFPTFGEAHPFFVLESFAGELPIITTKVGGIPEMVNQERGFLITPGCTEELAEAIKNAIDNKGVLPEMGRKARNFVLNGFTLDDMVNRHLELLKRNGLN